MGCCLLCGCVEVFGWAVIATFGLVVLLWFVCLLFVYGIAVYFCDLGFVGDWCLWSVYYVLLYWMLTGYGGCCRLLLPVNLVAVLRVDDL